MRRMTEAAAVGRGIDRGSMMVIGAMSIALVALTLDLSALNVALPAMQHAFHSDIGTMQWVLNGYAISFAVLLVTGGRLADILGRRRVYFVGTAMFGITALLGGLAPGEWWVVAARVAMGVAAALILPSATGIVYSALPADRAGLGGSIVVGSFGFGQAIGPLIAGVLTTYLSWRWVFFIDVPAAALAFLGAWKAPRLQRAAAEPGTRKIDYAGSVALSLAILALLFALDQGSDWGWTDPRVLGGFVLSIVAFAAFALIERRARERALLPPDVVGNRRFRIFALAALIAAPVYFSVLFYLPQFMDKVSGFDPLRVGVGMLPFMVALTLCSVVAGPVFERIGARATLSLGLLGMVVGCVGLGVAEGAYWELVPGMILAGGGLAFFASTATTSAVMAVTGEERSLAGGIMFTLRVGGGALGLGVMTAIVSTSGEHGPAFLDGFKTGFLVNAGFSLAALLVVALWVKKR